jgi:hypothetical protein
MNPMDGLRAAMAVVDAYYKERGIFQARFGYVFSQEVTLDYMGSVTQVG